MYGWCGTVHVCGVGSTVAGCTEHGVGGLVLDSKKVDTACFVLQCLG